MSYRSFDGVLSSRNHTTVKSESALKVQKAFLGFLVRKSFRKIINLDRRVEEISKLICREDSFDLIMKNEMERIKVNEALMSLILQLDSLTVYSGVKCCRKAVIKKAIALQETVDAIGSINIQTPHDCAEDFMIIDNAVDDSDSSSKSHATIVSAEIEDGLRRDVKNYRMMHKHLSDEELMEKIMEDNAKLLYMMQEAFETKRLQAQLISSLTERVEQLEQARMEENLRKIRKRRHKIEIVSSKQ